MPATTVLLATLVGTVTAFLLLWLLSVRLKDASIVDIYWGLGFAQIAIIACALGGGYPWRKLLITGCTFVWGLRLAGFLLWRNAGHGEDSRYQAMRRQHGERFWLARGFFLIACATPHGPWSIVGPALMTLFLMRVSGVTLLERKLVRSRPEYQEYMQRTNAFFPWLPKRGAP